MKKKLLSLALALVLSLSLCVPALAAEESDGLILKKGETTFTLEGITFTLSGGVIGQVSDESATFPRTGEIVNVVPAGTTITFSPVPENIDELIMCEPVIRDEDNPDAIIWGSVEMADVNGGVIGDVIILGGEEDVIYLCAADEGPGKTLKAAGEAAEDKKDEAPAEAEKPAETPAAPKFADVAADSPFAKAIDWAVEQKITTGKTETTFGPSDTCTVSHILTFLWRANGKPGAAEGVKDRDAAAKWAVEQELIPSASPDEYDLDAPCNRGAAVTFMWTIAGKPEVTSEKKFTDVPEGNTELVNATAWAVEKGVTTGTGDGTTFSSANKCTRGQIVTFLFRANEASKAAE